MGGRKHAQLGGHTGPPPRRAVPSAALTALAAALALGALLWGAAFPCARSVGSHGARTAVAQGQGQVPAHARAGEAAGGRAHGAAGEAAYGRPYGPAGEAAYGRVHADCVAPYQLPGCSPRSDTPPAVLPVPPSALAAAGAGAVVAVRPAYAGPVRAPGTLARAPDLHALQVLRT
ncbi:MULTISPECIES: hypothetical protein [unclassified Streptomyces]|uniref:hypothetical protein n=1 Tax=unclassified Streptomyces TaxID=2593676 RepID=UPI002E338C9D|nr:MULTISPECIES: hypothetical protein [unclassified Streptomyces]